MDDLHISNLHAQISDEQLEPAWSIGVQGLNLESRSLVIGGHDTFGLEFGRLRIDEAHLDPLPQFRHEPVAQIKHLDLELDRCQGITGPWQIDHLDIQFVQARYERAHAHANTFHASGIHIRRLVQELVAYIRTDIAGLDAQNSTE